MSLNTQKANIISTPEIITPISGDGMLIGVISYGYIGSSGRTKISQMDDVEFTNLKNNDIMQYNANVEKWENIEFPMTMNVTEDDVLNISLFKFDET